MASAFAPARVVSLQPSATVILERLGLLEHVVACTKWCRDVCPDIAGTRAIVADSWNARAAEILAAKPDLVIASVPYQVESLAEILKAGVPLLALAPKSLEDIYRDIAVIAATMNAGVRGDEVIAEMQSQIEQVRRRAAGAKSRPRVFCEEWGKPIIRSQRWVAELVEIAGGEFLGEPGAQTDASCVLAEDPDVVIAAWCGAGDRVPLEKIVRDRAWLAMSAVKNGRVFCLRDELLNTPAPTLIAGSAALAAAIHPAIFPPAPRMRRIAAPAAAAEH
jgi:iron complex transport system substrate-binding protein